MNQRTFTYADRLILNLDQALRTVVGRPLTTERPEPGRDLNEGKLNAEEQRLAGGLMRVNHSGEVAAQALYQGQALTARLPKVRDKMERAAREENDHLAWCEHRIDALCTHKSYLNPFWYAGSFAIGALAGAAGDKWSLGFVAETEHQVVRHLNGHLHRLPNADGKSRAVLEQMREDEGRHATVALEAGGVALPKPVKRVMRMTAKIMTALAFRI